MGGGGGGSVGLGGESGWGGQGGCERRSEAFVKIHKRGGGRSDQGLGWGRGAGSKVWGRCVIWVMGDVNQEKKALINVDKGFVQY